MAFSEDLFFPDAEPAPFIQLAQFLALPSGQSFPLPSAHLKLLDPALLGIACDAKVPGYLSYAPDW